MSKKARITIHPKFQIGEISPRLFSAVRMPGGNFVSAWLCN